MRTQQKDIRRVSVLTTLNAIPDAVRSNGVWSDGTPWHMVRNVAGGTGTGEYTMYFDTRIFVISGSVGPLAGGTGKFYKFEGLGAGSARVQVSNNAGDPINSANFDVTINVLDTRT